MKLSIITINFNNKDGLRKTIDSVISQTYRDFEWIIIDGGSLDGSKELIEQISKYLSYWVSEKDNGIYNAMNKGILKSHGDWLLFLNSGDWLYEDTTLERVFAQESTTADVMYGDKMQWTPDKCFGMQMTDNPSVYFFSHDSLCHQATFHRRTMFKNKLYAEDNKICSDWEFDFQAAIAGYHFEHIHQYIVYYDNTGVSSLHTKEQDIEGGKVWDRTVPFHLRYDLEYIKEIQSLYNGRFCSMMTRFCFALLKRMSSLRNKINKLKSK